MKQQVRILLNEKEIKEMILSYLYSKHGIVQPEVIAARISSYADDPMTAEILIEKEKT